MLAARAWKPTGFARHRIATGRESLYRIGHGGLDHWLHNVIAPNRRPATYELYELTVRLYLTPAIGSIPLVRLSAARVTDGQLRTGPVKTSAGRRDLPLLPPAVEY